MRFNSVITLLIFLSFVPACGQGRGDGKNRSRTNDSADAAEAKDTVAAKTQPETTEPIPVKNISDLFKDNADFVPSDLASGFIACAGLEGLTSASGSTIKWPEKMRSYLAKELMKFPDSSLVLSSVSGIYLTRADLLTSKERKNRVGGITCQNRKTAKSVIFLNEDEFVSSPKMKIKVGEWYETENLVHNSVLEQQGDQTLYTLIHELFHAIDLVHYIGGSNEAKKAGRGKITELAWNSLTSPKFERTGVIALTDAAYVKPVTPENLREHFVFSLHDEADDQVADYTALATETNFITPYSSANAIEDFADTLATYYFGTRYNSWMVRSVFNADLTVTPVSQAGLLYVFDTKSILHTSEAHKDKACQMVQLVFDENCENYLQLPTGKN